MPKVKKYQVIKFILTVTPILALKFPVQGT